MADRLVRFYRQGRSLGRCVLKDAPSWAEVADHLASPDAQSATCGGPEALLFVAEHGHYFDAVEAVPEPPTDYMTEANDDAKEMAREFLDQIVEQIIDNDEASDDLLNDYAGGDRYHNETNVDRHYRLDEAAEVLSTLSHYLKDDKGLWEGLDPEEAIGAQAAYTYGAAVYGLWQYVIESINDDEDVADVVSTFRELDSIDEDDYFDLSCGGDDPINLDPEGNPKPYLTEKLTEIMGLGSEGVVLAITEEGRYDLDQAKVHVEVRLEKLIKSLIDES